MPERHPYLSDKVQPLSKETDYFGHEDYAETLALESVSVQTPFTLGLFAPWGTGKSTILEATKTRLNEQGVAAVVFDVWKYEGDSLRRAFVTDIGRQLNRDGQLEKGFKLEPLLERFEADVAEPRPALQFSGRSLFEAGWRAVVAVACALLVLFGLPKLGMSDANATKVFVALASGLILYVLAALAKTIQIQNVQVTRKQIQDPDQFAKSFAELVSNGVKPQRLVIAVDNLDRCSPERVTEVLTTIKTFLEPAETGKDLVFLIAADDAALRRHLIAQELAASGGESAYSTNEMDAEEDRTEDRPTTSEFAPQRQVPWEVGEAVDEYLRKFFNGTLRLNDVLDEDIRDFTQAQLDAFIAAHQLSEEDASRLVELVATALRQNPRRIKQFINGLELRLRLFERRRASERIQIEADILVVAKLAIIEEEFSDRFQELRRDPKVLAAWHEEARTGRSGIEDSYSQWQVFLRNTERIKPVDLRPYLTLKQSQRERELPRFQEFVDALEGGSVDRVDEILDAPEVADKRSEYVRAVPDRLREVIRKGFRSAATNVVRTAISSTALQADAASVLDEAMRHPPLRESLGELPPDALLAAARGLPSIRFNDVADTLLGRFEETDEGADEGRSTISEALAGEVERLDERRKGRLRDALAKSGISKDFPAVVPFAEQDATAIPQEPVTQALEALDSDPQFATTAASYRIVKAVLMAHEAPPYNQIQKFGEAVWRALLARREDADEFATLAQDAASIIGRFNVPRTSFKEQIEQFEVEWAELAPAVRPSAVRYVGALLDAGTEEAREQYAARFLERFFSENSEAAVAWLEDGVDQVANSFDQVLDAQLIPFLSGGRGDSSLKSKILEVVRSWDAERVSRLVGQAVRDAVQADRFEHAPALLLGARDLLGEAAHAEAVSGLLDRAEQDPALDEPSLLNAVVSLPPSSIGERARARQAGVLAQTIIHGKSDWQGASAALKEDEEFRNELPTVVSAVFDHVMSGGDVWSHRVELEFLRDEADHLTQAQAHQLGSSLAQAINDVQPGHPVRALEAIAQVLGRLGQADTERRNDWVTKLILQERKQGDISVRGELLTAAARLTGHKNSNGWRELSERLKELRKDDEDELADRVERAAA